MPCIRVDGQRQISVVHAACVKEYKDSGEKTEIRQKTEEYIPDRLFPYPGQEQAYIHGKTAELEREIPPVVVSAAQPESQTVLFPDFAGGHKYTAEQEESTESVYMG